MGHYTGHHFRVILKADAPDGILDQLRDLAGLKEEDETALPNPAQLINSSESTGLVVSHDAVLEMLADIQYSMNGWSAYLGTWTEHNRLELLDDGRWLLYTKCSNKHTHNESIKNFLDSLLPFTDMEDGDVVFRAIYEDGRFEDIYYVSGGEIHYKEGGGYYYYDSYDDDEHPGNDCDVDWDPPMNIGPLREATQAKIAEHPPGSWWKDPWAHPEMPEDLDHSVDAIAFGHGLVSVTIDSIPEVGGEFAPFKMPEVPEAYMNGNGNLVQTPMRLPLVIRPLNNDIPEDQQRGYASKEEVEINGQKYIQYFGPFTGPRTTKPAMITGCNRAVMGTLSLGRDSSGLFDVVEGAFRVGPLDKHVAEGKLLNGGLDLLALLRAPGVEGLFSKTMHLRTFGIDPGSDEVQTVGMGRYYSEVVDFGQQGYAAHIEYAYYQERRIRSVRERMRPAKAKHLAKLKRYMDRVVVLARPLKLATGTESSWAR